MTLHDHERPFVLATVLGTFVAPLALFALGAPSELAAAFALAVPFFSLVHLEARLTAHHRASPCH